ncbi:hypothetical protein KPSA3_00951 [Pseudomonas syringae pv. actinidiae]|uniref:Uncharacterized protein n=1 Tax=Pseudomonas syringae pv. actinidiae TaxID=103796 RepID=A0AAN4TIV7_PSESF|nr:hypothetical protein KPSA3_00951 [Pseudomonas syringae pv. actinidiae]
MVINTGPVNGVATNAILLSVEFWKIFSTLSCKPARRAATTSSILRIESPPK